MDRSNDKPPHAEHKVSRRELGAGGLAMVATAGLAARAPSAAAQPGATGADTISASDRFGIQDLFTDYLWAYDCTDEELFASLFTDDALVVGRGTHYRDRAAIIGWFRYLIDIRETAGDDIWMHEAGQFRFTTSGEGWLVHCYATHFNGNTHSNTRGVRSLGYFTCECVKQADGWKFRRFSITTWDRTMVPWKKPLPWADA